MTPFLAVDWGTTNRRVFLIDEGGAVSRTERDDRGVIAMRGGDYAAEVAGIRQRFGALPILCAGMVGSNIGWRDAGYVDTPGGLEALAARAPTVAGDVWIVPGMAHREGSRGDVMRGEEVQFLGAVAGGLTPADALVIQPGTHCKWARISRGGIAAFTTAMTGELFALLKGHGLLSAELTAPVSDNDAFRQGVEDAGGGDLLARLFGIRAASVLGLRDRADQASYASGLLIGSDVAAQLARADDARVFILSDPALGGLYATAIAAHGRQPVVVQSHDAFVAGITRLWRLIA
jgi:2-dehydro-3-deoxygalactonokinase